jgi:outer membrane protein assembly factor BamA
MAADSRNWQNGRLQTLLAAGVASINLDYYGLGDDARLRDHPLRYNLAPVGGQVRVKYRLGRAQFWGGLGYSLAATEVGFNAPAGTPGLPSFQRKSRTATLTPSLSYDTRDSIFTPTRGLYVEASAGLSSEALGGDQDFQKAGLVVIDYVPLADKWTLGLRADANFSFGDMPFYLRPSVQLRGVAAMSCQGNDAAQVEAELRWQFHGRYSLVGFSGAGTTWGNSGPFGRRQTVVTWGTGFRYEIARKYGLHMGVDVAFGPADPALYIQFGSAWMRP